MTASELKSYDFGSDYGHKIDIKYPTLLIIELDELSKENILLKPE